MSNARNDDPCEVASLHLIRALDDIAKTPNKQRKIAAQIASVALLAIRDTHNRPLNPEIATARLDKIMELLENLNP